MNAVFESGLSVPEDISVIGFDDIDLSTYIQPPLTTVRISRTEIARTAFRALFDPEHDGSSQGGGVRRPSNPDRKKIHGKNDSPECGAPAPKECRPVTAFRRGGSARIGWSRPFRFVFESWVSRQGYSIRWCR